MYKDVYGKVQCQGEQKQIPWNDMRKTVSREKRRAIDSPGCVFYVGIKKMY